MIDVYALQSGCTSTIKAPCASLRCWHPTITRYLRMPQRYWHLALSPRPCWAGMCKHDCLYCTGRWSWQVVLTALVLAGSAGSTGCGIGVSMHAVQNMQMSQGLPGTSSPAGLLFSQYQGLPYAQCVSNSRWTYVADGANLHTSCGLEVMYMCCAWVVLPAACCLYRTMLLLTPCSTSASGCGDCHIWHQPLHCCFTGELFVTTCTCCHQ